MAATQSPARGSPRRHWADGPVDCGLGLGRGGPESLPGLAAACLPLSTAYRQRPNRLQLHPSTTTGTIAFSPHHHHHFFFIFSPLPLPTHSLTHSTAARIVAPRLRLPPSPAHPHLLSLLFASSPSYTFKLFYPSLAVPSRPVPPLSVLQHLFRPIHSRMDQSLLATILL